MLFLPTLMLALVVYIFATSSVTLAAPRRSNLEAQKRQVAEQLRNLNGELDEAVEAYNEARLKLSSTKNKVAKVQNEIEQTQSQIITLEQRLLARARVLYMLDRENVLAILVGTESFNDLITNWQMFSSVVNRETELNRDYKEKKASLEQNNKELMNLLSQQKSLVSRLNDNKKQIENKIAEKQRILDSLDSEIREALRREELERQRALAEAAAALRARTRDLDRSYSSRGTSRGGNSQVVQIALSLLGKPYRWGAAGPNSFDCSGFTMYVYAKLGVYLPHSSAAQYSVGERVSYGELQAGDLVFFARRGGRISHVGIYIGDGMFVHAPQTGDVVRVKALSEHGGYVGATRP